MNKASLTDDLLSGYDAIHGSIDVSDVVNEKIQGTIAKLLRSRLLERLRSIKQLGFVSRGYPAADHSRFGHAAGTMQMMRKLYHRVRANNGLPAKLFDGLENIYGLKGGKNEKWNHIANHLMLAALLQDIGELPYHQATKHFFRASDDIKRLIRKNIGDHDFSKWKEKDLFTIGCVLSCRHELREKFPESGLFDEISLPLLTYLITEKSRTPRSDKTFRPLRHMLDGAVDADRLDYVYRDGHHTIGYFGTPQAVIDSLLGYTNEGPVFSDPAPVSNLLLMRAHLYITVYLSPVDRFQTQLLRTILADVQRIERPLGKAGVFANLLDNVEVGEFLKLDDASLISRVQAVEEALKAKEGNVYKTLSPKTRAALRIFLEHQGDYESIWVLPREAGGAPQPEIDLPDDLFFDNFSDKDLQIYRPGTIHIDSSRFGNRTVLLEETSGIFRGIADGKWSPLPKPGSILLFKPKDDIVKGEASWDIIRELLGKEALYQHLIQKVDIDNDTRGQREFSGPDLFISHAFLDQPKMFLLAAEFSKRRQKYFFLDKYGPNRPAADNIKASVAAAGAALIFLSSNFLNRLIDDRNGNLAIELLAIGERSRRRRGLPVVIVNIDAKKEQVKDIFPWHYFGHSGPPVVKFPPLDISNQYAVGKEVERILRRIRKGPGPG